jgi:ankyrin repeat protein
MPQRAASLKRYVHVLLESNASAAGCCLLHDAARSEDVDVAEDLLRHGADIDARDGRGRTPLDMALQTPGRAATVTFLYGKSARHDRGWDLLRWAAREGAVSFGSDLLDRAAAIDAVSSFPDEIGSDAPLHRAV